MCGVVILAAGFDILLGRIEIEVPWVVPDSDYSLVREYKLRCNRHTYAKIADRCPYSVRRLGQLQPGIHD